MNKQLEKMGYNIGTRLIEDFLARSNLGRCTDFREVGEVVAKVRHDLDYDKIFYSQNLCLSLSLALCMVLRSQVGWVQGLPKHISLSNP